MKKEVGGENLKISKRQGLKEQKQEDWDIVHKWYSIVVAKGKKGYPNSKEKAKPVRVFPPL